MTREDAAKYAKEHLRDYLESRGISTSSPFRCLNPGHPDEDPSMSFDRRRNKAHCFGCNADYDTLDLIGIDLGLTDYPAKVDAAAAFFNISIDGAGEKPKRSAAPRTPAADQTRTQPAPEPPKQPAADYSDFITQASGNLEKLGEIRETGAFRGIFRETLERFKIGYVENFQGPMSKARGWNGIIIPTGDGKSSYVIRNADKNAAIRYMATPGPRHLLNAAALYNAEWGFPVFICEGEIDALSVLNVGAEAVGLGSADNTSLLLDLLREKPPLHPLILSLDNDETGQKATERLIEGTEKKPGLKQLSIPFVVANIAGDRKDANEALTEWGIENFARSVADAIEAVPAELKRKQEEAKEAERERQRITGAGMVDAFLADVRSRKYQPIPTGISDIDRAIGGGFIRQQLVLLGAAPGTGKTALAQWIFEGMATRQGTRCLYLNLEMSREQILARSFSRILAAKGYTIRPTQILQGYSWNFEQEEQIKRAAEEYKAKIAPFMVYNPEGTTADLDSILSYIEGEIAAAEKAGLPAPLVCLDYLQIVTGKEREDAAAVIKRAVGQLKKIAIEHNTVFFVIIAHNREANKSGDVTMESGRDTSALEYSADLQLGLTFTACVKRPGNPNPKSKDELTEEEKRQLTLKVTKGRFAAPGASVDLLFNGETMTYTQTARINPAPETHRGAYRV